MHMMQIRSHVKDDVGEGMVMSFETCNYIL